MITIGVDPHKASLTAVAVDPSGRSLGQRRLLVNACYWAVGLEEKIPAKSDVAIVGAYEPRPFGFGTFQKGVKPADLLK